MVNWRDSDGQTFLGPGLSIQDMVESALGQQDAMYTPTIGAPYVLPGILLARRSLLEDISEYVGRIDTERRYKCQRIDRTLASFPQETNGSRYGTLNTAGQVFPVVGVAYEKNSHITLFLGDPLA
jgi:hypothetical protein